MNARPYTHTHTRPHTHTPAPTSPPHPHAQRAEELRRAFLAAHALKEEKSVELACFKLLADTEDAALPQRVADLYDNAKNEQERNATLQTEYSTLVKERDYLWGLLSNATGADAGTTGTSTPTAGETSMRARTHTYAHCTPTKPPTCTRSTEHSLAHGPTLAHARRDERESEIKIP